jgi:replicative DNA helicase
MQEKLTLRLDGDIVRHAKVVAKKTGKSVSRMVADYFALFKKQPEPDDSQLSPIVRSLKGSLRRTKVDVKDYYRHLEEKHLP